MAHILIVDDEVSMVKMITAVLEMKGHRVLAASNGVHALEILPQGGVDLVVTDIKMPKMNGFELIPALLELFPEQRIIAMSGGGIEGPEGNLRIARDLGATRCMAKPFELRKFSAHVEELLS
jgi:CheY-like chemotaxis protein